MDERIRCAAVDAHPCLLEGLERVFRTADDIELVARAADAEAALEAVHAHAPDVMVTDVRLPGMDGIEAIGRLAEVAPAVTAVVYSADGDRNLLSDAIGAGARGYVLKGSPVSDLLRAVRSVAAGDAYVDPALSPTLMMDRAAPGTPLARREREVLQLLAEGLGTEQVAARIGISGEMVKAETKRAVARLEATGRVHAVANALRHSYIS